MDCIIDFLDESRAIYTAETPDGIGKALVFSKDNNDPPLSRDKIDGADVLVRIGGGKGVTYRWFPVELVTLHRIV